MQKQFAKYISVVLLFIFGFTAIATGATQVSSLSLRLTNNIQSGNSSSIKGRVTAAESDLPLAYGTVIIAGKTATIHDGYFEMENLVKGDHLLRVDGPFRETLEIIISTSSGENNLDLAVKSILSQAEIDMLARITRAEAEGESHRGQTAVAASVLNRVLSSRYPSNVQEVVYQKISGRYQYSPVSDGRIRLAPKTASYHAAHAALAGNDPSLGATGFFNPTKTRDLWVRSNPVTTIIDGHTFFSY